MIKVILKDFWSTRNYDVLHIREGRVSNSLLRGETSIGTQRQATKKNISDHNFIKLDTFISNKLIYHVENRLT